MSNEFLKRGKGKNNASIKKYDFYSYYLHNTKHKQKIPRKVYDRFTGALLKNLATAIVTEALEVKLGRVGKIRVRSKKLNFVREDGTLSKSLKVDWNSTWNMWHEKYPELTKDEIVALKGKKVLYFDNSHTNEEFYAHVWDNLTTPLKYKKFYKFVPSRTYSRLIAKLVTDENRKIYYYG
jgi:hypothetical protein